MFCHRFSRRCQLGFVVSILPQVRHRSRAPGVRPWACRSATMPLTAQLAGNAQALAGCAVTASFGATDHARLIRPSGQAAGVVRAHGGVDKFRCGRCLRVCGLGMSRIEVTRARTRLRCVGLFRYCRTCSRPPARALCQIVRSRTRVRTCLRIRSYSHARVLVSNSGGCCRTLGLVYSGLS